MAISQEKSYKETESILEKLTKTEDNKATEKEFNDRTSAWELFDGEGAFLLNAFQKLGVSYEKYMAGGMLTETGKSRIKQMANFGLCFHNQFEYKRRIKLASTKNPDDFMKKLLVTDIKDMVFYEGFNKTREKIF